MSAEDTPSVGPTSEDASLPDVQSVVWRAEMKGPVLFGLPRGPFDPLSIIMVVVLGLNLWMGNWLIVGILVAGLAFRWWFLRDYLKTKGIVEHEVDSQGVRRGDQRYGWDEFGSYWIYHTDHPATLELVVQRQDPAKHPLRVVMPAKALTLIRGILDKHVECREPASPPHRR